MDNARKMMLKLTQKFFCESLSVWNNVYKCVGRSCSYLGLGERNQKPYQMWKKSGEYPTTKETQPKEAKCPAVTSPGNDMSTQVEGCTWKTQFLPLNWCWWACSSASKCIHVWLESATDAQTSNCEKKQTRGNLLFSSLLSLRLLPKTTLCCYKITALRFWNLQNWNSLHQETNAKVERENRHYLTLVRWGGGVLFSTQDKTPNPQTLIQYLMACCNWWNWWFSQPIFRGNCVQFSGWFSVILLGARSWRQFATEYTQFVVWMEEPSRYRWKEKWWGRAHQGERSQSGSSWKAWASQGIEWTMRWVFPFSEQTCFRPHPHRTRNATQSKWDLLMWMGVSTLHASNIKGFVFEFACARLVWIGP